MNEIIIGINWEQNSTASLMINGEIKGCVSEERFSNIKNDERCIFLLSNKISLIFSDNFVPPGSLKTSNGIFLISNNFLSKSICVDFPDPSIPSKVINLPFIIL